MIIVTHHTIYIYGEAGEMDALFQGRAKGGRVARLSFLIFFLASIALINTDVFATIPLITDDTGIQGKGKFQVELSGAYSDDREDGVTSKGTDFSTTFSYGILNEVDIVLSFPYRFLRREDDESTNKTNGFSDIAIEAKWRFFEKNGFSMALKPGITLSTGNEDKDLGKGRSAYYLYFITSKEIAPWAFHINLAYSRNENKIDERNDIWHTSLASTVEIIKNFKLVGDIGVESNPEKSSAVLPAYILGGFIYSLKEDFDIGLGLKGGLTRVESDLSVRGGITWRF
ncbi:MAG: transporter [Syntrophus sp. (in: bacteria)]|nr:transporter [Syntrophus sp. (in: bacteria)]